MRPPLSRSVLRFWTGRARGDRGDPAALARRVLPPRVRELYADSYDALIEESILEHWHAVLVHGAPALTMAWFAPHAGTLGYNDTYVLPALACVPARMLGRTRSSRTSRCAWSCGRGMYALLRRGVAVGWALALVGAAVFTTANASLLQIYHAQLLVAAGVAALVPLALVYLPLCSGGARHAWPEGVPQYVPPLATFVNVGAGNLLWGVWPDVASGPVGEALLRWLSNFTLWEYVFRWVPGAGALRTVSRYLVFGLVPVTLLGIVFLDRAGFGHGTTAVIAALLLVEQVQLQPPPGVDRAAQRAMLAEVRSPPAGCRAFFVVRARRPSFGDRALPRDRHNVDAILIAATTRVPTINGVSTATSISMRPIAPITSTGSAPTPRATD